MSTKTVTEAGGANLRDEIDGLLVKHMDILNTTHLMRYPKQISAFRTLFRNSILSQREEQPDKPATFSIVSLGCSAGHEPASLAATAIDEVDKLGLVLGKDVNLSVLGVDKDERMVAAANLRLGEGFSVDDTRNAKDVDSLLFVNSNIARIREVVRIRHADASAPEEIPEIVDADAVFANAIGYQMVMERQLLFDAFQQGLKDRLKPGAVVFTTDNLFDSSKGIHEVDSGDFRIYRKNRV